ncbi:MAG TPA: indole-3-glycerol phosphate synthase TrpC [Terriglobia bacterium]|nr:indole-3-glycerol phosphate synthase TrpC [Terriglobia bacterium]
MKPLGDGHILAKIVRAQRDRLRNAKMRVPEAIVRRMAQTTGPAPSFAAALANPKKVRLIAEIKKASPSKGVFRTAFDVEALARTYSAAGASAISVVTEEDFFQGSVEWISRVRKVSDLPVLRKDFVFEPYQVYETRAVGASAILLIASMLDSDEIASLAALARELSLDALVEVHDEAELDDALAAGAPIIGVNNRDLKTFAVDVETSVRLGAKIPDDRIFVVESGIHARADIDRLLGAGADAFLVGEHLLTSDNPATAIGALL